MILAAVSHPVFGIPKLTTKLHSRDIKEAKETKQKLLNGNESTLKTNQKTKRNIFTKEVDNIAKQYCMIII